MDTFCTFCSKITFWRPARQPLVKPIEFGAFWGNFSQKVTFGPQNRFWAPKCTFGAKSHFLGPKCTLGSKGAPPPLRLPAQPPRQARGRPGRGGAGAVRRGGGSKMPSSRPAPRMGRGAAVVRPPTPITAGGCIHMNLFFMTGHKNTFGDLS